MTRQSPAVGRVVAVLNFFIEHSRQAFTLTQVAKSLRLSRATTLSILLGLVDAGYLYRHPDKSFIIGPVLHSLAGGANPPLPPLAVASHEMRALADEFDIVASALFQEDDHLVVRERAASVNHLGAANLSSKQQYPAYPWGSPFLTPLSDQEIAAKLERAMPPLDDGTRHDVLTGIEFARRRGFIAALVADGTQPRPEPSRPTGQYILELDPEAAYHLLFIVAPVIGVSGEVDFAISLFGFRSAMSGAEVAKVGERLRETCRRVGAYVTAAPIAADRESRAALNMG